MTFETGRLICSELVEAEHNTYVIENGLFTFDCDEAKTPHTPTVVFFVGDIVVVVLEGDDLLTLVIMSDQDYSSSVSFIGNTQLATSEEINFEQVDTSATTYSDSSSYSGD